MSQRPPFAAEWSELERIDYFLDQLARAVERGEVPRESYDALAPRYLARRAELVAIVQQPPIQPDQRVRADRPPRGWRPAAEDFSATGGSVAAIAQPRESKPVAWTTVLLFLGAFLVIVAASIFAVAVWDLIGVGGKLAFLGSLTAGFYAAGWWARVKLELKAGSTALFAVASAMLLLDGWIVIDGSELTGPLPWAVLMLVCSAVYWYTEVRLADRFFGAIGAAAQLVWWWLLGMGLGWPAPTRLAAIAVVALVWHLAAERSRGQEGLRSLAVSLSWAAPIVTLVAALGLLGDLALVRSATVSEVVAAAVVGASGLAVLGGTTLLDTRLRWWLAALLQLPVFAAVLVASATTGAAWSIAVVLAALAVLYHLLGIYRAGVPMSLAGLAAELACVVQICLVLEVEATTTIVAVAALGALWAAGGRLAAGLAEQPDAPSHVLAVAVVAETGAVALLSACAFLLPVVAGAVPLTGVPVERLDALASVGVLAAWGAAAVARPRGPAHLGTAFVSFYALAAAMAWRWPAASPAQYALGMLVLAAIWLLLEVFRDGEADSFGQVLGVSMRVAAVIVIAAGLLLERVWATGDAPAWTGTLLAVAGAALFLVDTAASRTWTSAAVAGALLATAGFEAGSFAADDSASGRVLGAVVGALVGTAGAVVARSRLMSRRACEALAYAAAGAGTLLALAPGADDWVSAAALAGSTVVWVLAGLAVGQTAAVPSAITGLATLGFVLSAADASPWVTVLVFSVAGLVLHAASLAPALTAGGRLEFVGSVLAIAGVAGHGSLVFAGAASEITSSSVWWAVGEQGAAIGLLVMGAGVLVQAYARRIEVAWYAGFALVLLALLAQLDVMGIQTPELYTTPTAVYLAGMGYLRRRLRPLELHPGLLDAAAMAVGLGIPLVNALDAYPPSSALVHAAWVVGLSLVTIAAGIVLKVRWYLFGGVAALAAIAFYRSFVSLVDYWWLVLGVLGVLMLVIALTWERQRLIVSDTRERLKASFQGWR